MDLSPKQKRASIRDRLSKGKVITGMFHPRVEDIEFDEQVGSPTKILDKQEEKEDQEDYRNSPRRKKRDFNLKLQPLEAPEVKKIPIMNFDSQGEDEDIKDVSDDGEATSPQRKKLDIQSAVQDDFEEPHSQQNKQVHLQQKTREKREGARGFDDSNEEEEEDRSEENPRAVAKPGYENPEMGFSSSSQSLSLIVRREKQWFDPLHPQFDIYYKMNNDYFFSAKMTGNNAITTFVIGKNRNEFKENDESYLGKVKTNFIGNEALIFGPGHSPLIAEEKNVPLREMLASVEYETNFLGSSKPRYFKVFVLKPSVHYHDLRGTSRYSEQPLNELYKLEENRKHIWVMVNKKPQWSESINGYMLNFGGKVKKASIKNFILVDESRPENIHMIFGKTGEDEFIMEVSDPLSPVVGLGIALSSFGSKIGCE